MTLSDTPFSSEQAKIAEAAGACAVMALERIPDDAAWCRGRIRWFRNLQIR